jgi:hypothetical protein
MRRIQTLGLLWWFCGAASAATVTVGTWTPIFKGIDLASGQQEATMAGEFNHRVLCYRVDLADPEVVLFTTPKCTNCGGYDTVAQNTSHFLEQYGLQVAINGGFYSSSAGPNDVPLGTPEDVRGMALSLGNLVSPADDPTRAATLLFTTNNQPTIIPNNNPGANTEGIYTAISGDRPLLTNGVVAVVPNPNDRDPRTAFGVSQDRRYLYLLTLDGRQPGWSDGADWYNTALWLQRFGAHDGINVDGGGSTTSVMADCQGKAVRLNRSSFVAAYGRERIIGHNFGVYAPSLPSELKNLAVTPAQTTAVITWETDFEATSQVEYGPTASFGLTTPLDTRPKRKHVATLAGLAQGSNYFFRALSAATSAQGEYTQACRFTTVAALSRTELFGLTQTWRFTTNNLDGTNWKTPAYNDSAWLGQGPGLLYVLENSAQVAPRNTQMPPTSGTSIPRTYYLRTHFNFSGGTAGLSLLFSNYVDDGAVFYLNGAEIFRLRMAAPPAVIANNSAATGTPCTGTAQAGDAATICPDVFSVSGSLLANLVQGDNVLAVEVHNAIGTDLVFGSALLQVSAVQVRPQLSIWPEGDLATLFWNGEGFTLQQSTDLGSAANWSDVPGAAQSPVTRTNSASAFYRLRN